MQGFEKSYEITSARRGNFTRFVNHACIPNCSIQRIVWKKRRCLVYRVVHPIDVFDEITVDYQYDYWRELYKGVGAGIEKVQALCRCDAFRHNLREEDEAVFLQWANDEAKRIEYWPMLKKEVPQHPVTPRMDM